MATSTLGSGTLVLAGTTSGTTTVTATAVAGTTTLTLPAATDTLVGKATTDTLTNKTLTGAAMNGTVGATTPAAGAFTTLSATGVTTVQAGSAASPAITTTGDTNTGIFFPAADTIAFSEGGVEAMRIDSSGQVGIGITSPSTPLHVQGNSSGLSLRVQGRSSDGYADISLYNNANTVNNAFFGSSNTTTFLGTGTTIPLTFQTNNAERMRIDSSGNFLVGTTDTALYDNTSGSGACYRANASFDVAAANDNCVILNRMTSTGQIQEFRYAGGAVGNISTNGSTITFSGTALSDLRWKENVAPIEDALSSVMEIDFVSFEFKDSGNSSAGVTAQQLQTISAFSKYVNNGLSDEDYKTVDYNALIGFLGKSIQEQQALITALTARITALETP